MEFNQPRPLSVEEIKTLVQRWAYGAEVLHKAGADGMQLHGAHGYLLSQVSLLFSLTSREEMLFGVFSLSSFSPPSIDVLLVSLYLILLTDVSLPLYSSSLRVPTSELTITEETLRTDPESFSKSSTRSSHDFPRTSSSR